MHQLEEGVGGGVGVAAANTRGKALSLPNGADSLSFIQLPSTSANDLNHTSQIQQAATSPPPPAPPPPPVTHPPRDLRQACLQSGGAAHGNPVRRWLTGALEDGRSDVFTTSTSAQSRQTGESLYSSCQRDAAAAARNLMMLKHNHYAATTRRKEWRRNCPGEQQQQQSNHQQQRQQQLHHSQQQQQITSIEMLHAETAAATATASTQQHRVSSNSSNSNESDNISDDSIPPPPNYHEIPGIVPSYHGRTSGPPPAYDDVVNPNAPPPSYQSLFGQVREARKSSNGLVDLLRQLLLVLIGTIGCTMIIGFLLLIPITMIFVGFFYINECRAENIPSFLVVGGFVWIIKNILNCYNQFKKDSSVNRPPPRRAAHLAASSGNGAATGSGSTVGTTMAATATSTTANRLDVASTSSSTSAITVDESPSGQPTGGGSEQIVINAPTITTTTTTTTTTTPAPTIAQADNQQQHRQQPRRVRQPQMIGLTSDKCESILNYFLLVWFLTGCIVVYRIYEPDYDNPLSLSYCNRTVYLYAFWLMTSAFIIMAIVLSCLCCLMASSLMSCSHGR